MWIQTNHVNIYIYKFSIKWINKLTFSNYWLNFKFEVIVITPKKIWTHHTDLKYELTSPNFALLKTAD